MLPYFTDEQTEAWREGRHLHGATELRSSGIELEARSFSGLNPSSQGIGRLQHFVNDQILAFSHRDPVVH